MLSISKSLSISGPGLRQYNERPECTGGNSLFSRRRPMRRATVSFLLVTALFGIDPSANAADKATPESSRQFDALKSLAGDWVAIGKDGKPTDKVVSSIRVTAALFPGSDHEMVTMYHLDRGDLILTHYCMLGNQPRMRAEPGTDVNRIVFKFIGGTNLKSDNEQHMHQATLTIRDNDHFTAEWVSCKDGSPCHQVSLDLARKQK
jgi:hypothetical protein